MGVQFLDVAERQDETAPKCIGHRMVAASLNAMGDFRPALPHAEAAVVLYDPELHGPLAWRYVHDLGVAALNHLGIALWHAGRADHSLAREREALELADQLQHVNTTCYALFYCGALSALRRRDFAELRRFAARLQAYVREHKMPHWAPFAVCLVGAALAAAGQAEEGIDLCQDGIKVCEATGTKAFLPAFLAGLAEAQLAAGRPEQAERTIVTALRMSRRTAERWMDAELWRLAGQASVLSGRHAPGRAERLFRRAAGLRRGPGLPATPPAGGDQPRPALARPRPGRGGARPSRTGLRPVRRGRRHARLPRGQAAARGALKAMPGDLTREPHPPADRARPNSILNRCATMAR